MNNDRSTPNTGHSPSPPAANWRNHPPGADDGAGDGLAGENAFMPSSTPLPLQMMSTLQARLEQAAMSGDGPHSTLAERARYAAMFQNMEQQLPQVHQHRNQQQQQVQSRLPPRPTPRPMTQSMLYRRAAAISRNQRNQRLQQRQQYRYQEQIRPSALMEYLRARERLQLREHNEPQQVLSAPTSTHDAILRELELHRSEITRIEFTIQRQHQIERQNVERIVRDLSQCEQRLLQFARNNNISISAENPSIIFRNLDNSQAAHMGQPTTQTGVGMQQLIQPSLQYPRTVQSVSLSSSSMLPSQISPSTLPSQTQNSNFWEERQQYLNRFRDIVTANIYAHATQNATCIGQTNDPNNLLNSSSMQWPGANQLNADSVTNNGIAQSLMHTFQTLQAVTENANRLTAFFHSAVVNANRQNAYGNPPAVVSFETNQTSFMPNVYVPVLNLVNCRLFSQEPCNQQFSHDQSFNHNSNSGSSNLTNQSISSTPEYQQQPVNINQQSIDPRSFLIPCLYNQNNTNNIYVNNNYACENFGSCGYYTLLGNVANRNCIEGINYRSPASPVLNNRSSTFTVPMPEQHGNPITNSDASDDSASESYRKHALQQWQHFAKIAHENLLTANRVLETLYERPEYAESYLQYHGRTFSRTETSDNTNVNTTAATTTGYPTISNMAGAPSNLSTTSSVSSEDDNQTINQLNTQVENITINPVATKDNTIPSISPRKLSEKRSSWSSSETPRAFGNDKPATSITNNEEYLQYNSNNFSISDAEMNRYNSNYSHADYSEACNGNIEENHNFMNRNISDLQYLEQPNYVGNSDNFTINNDMNYNHSHFGKASTGAVEDNYLEKHVLKNPNFMDRSFTDLHYLDPNGVENSNSSTVNRIETHSFPEVFNGAIERNHFSTDSHYLVGNDVENRAYECNRMGDNVFQNNDDAMGSHSIERPFYECNNSDNQNWTYSHLENNHLESDEMVNSSHSCPSTYSENNKCLENNGLQVNGLANSDCAETLRLDNHDFNYNNLQGNNYMKNNQNPFVEFNNSENHNSNWNNYGFLKNSEDLA